MGCDIHGWVEVKQGGKWVAVKPLNDRDRNYNRFARLAGVRNYDDVEAEERLGVPVDVSDTAAYDIEEWAGDGHSHSYMKLSKAASIFNETAHEPSKWPSDTFFEVCLEDNPDKEYRLVFWFDN